MTTCSSCYDIFEKITQLLIKKILKTFDTLHILDYPWSSLTEALLRLSAPPCRFKTTKLNSPFSVSLSFTAPDSSIHNNTGIWLFLRVSVELVGIYQCILSLRIVQKLFLDTKKLLWFSICWGWGQATHGNFHIWKIPYLRMGGQGATFLL